MADQQQCSLTAIEAKYNINCGGSIEKLDKETLSDLVKLSEEFDTLDLPKIEINNVRLVTPILDQLIHNSYLLIKMFRRRLKEITDIRLANTKHETQRLKQNGDIDSFKSAVLSRDVEIKNLKHELFKIKCNYDEQLNTSKNLTAELAQIRAAYKAKLKEHEHVSKQMKNEIESLKEKCGESLGKYKSSDSFLVDYLEKYKAREEVYKETITKLQQNNSGLLQEVLELKEQVLYYMIRSTPCLDS